MLSAVRGLWDFFKINVFAFVFLENLAAAALALSAFGVRGACTLALSGARLATTVPAFPAGREAEE